MGIEMKELKLSNNIIYNYEIENDIYICCFLDDDADSIIELSGQATSVFKSVINGDFSKLNNENLSVAQKLLDLGILQSEAVQDSNLIKSDLETKLSQEFNELGIKLKTYDELYSTELAAYGFTTLTATNSSSYSDSS